MQPRHIQSAIEILKNMKYMTTATVCEDGSPWNTPVGPNLKKDLTFTWGSNENSVHSQNIRKEKRVFIVIYDSRAEEGTGEGIYMKGEAEELDEYEGTLKMYRFVPEKVWINDVVLDDKGAYLYDVRVELDLSHLKDSIK